MGYIKYGEKTRNTEQNRIILILKGLIGGIGQGGGVSLFICTNDSPKIIQDSASRSKSGGSG